LSAFFGTARVWQAAEAEAGGLDAGLERRVQPVADVGELVRGDPLDDGLDTGDIADHDRDRCAEIKFAYCLTARKVDVRGSRAERDPVPQGEADDFGIEGDVVGLLWLDHGPRE
jgi:hypothetical protein